MSQEEIHYRGAQEHFKRLAELLLEVQVTDLEGRTLSLDDGAQMAVGLIKDVREKGGKVISVGNGGSAAIASHLHNDLSSAGVRSLIFSDTPLLTALANDFGYAQVFARPLELWAARGDLVVAVSSSGRSENILAAVGLAKEMGLEIVTLTGFDAANPLRSLGRINFWADSHDYGLVETAHQALTHYLSDRLKEED